MIDVSLRSSSNLVRRAFLYFTDCDGSSKTNNGRFTIMVDQNSGTAHITLTMKRQFNVHLKMENVIT